MKRFYSRTTGNTYLAGYHTSLPDDAVEIDNERYDAVIANPKAGTARAHDDEGLPVLVELAPLSDEELSQEAKAWRDQAFDRVVWLRDRHRDEVELMKTTTLSDSEYQELLVYLQALRKWPQAKKFPSKRSRPKRPAWLVD
ncbi:Caudovirales tail fiber assembly protein [Pseudomonas sp. GM50]|uniref:tail fiber assembly protein n=1 Tax=Pseudomonas sp. GM50 TaxID=1144332 RepID=UPI000270D6D7|nr:tail fiber assembly protein [Pseudomonas sp. GM50]EJM65579.1 Caudovirales tail fiber assembly protein [Pseudomonas sp. GM50]